MKSIAGNNKTAYRLILGLLLLFSIFVLIKLAPTFIKPNFILADDYLHFWASGTLNLHGGNPFDEANVEQVTRSQLPAGMNNALASTAARPITLNLPWFISIIMPFSMLSYPISRVIWLLFSIMIILLSALMAWKVETGKPQRNWLAILIAFTFAPTISVLEKGQIAPLLLFGIAGFLFFSVFQKKDWQGGAFLALLTVKPQVVLLLWIPLLFWVIIHRRWKVILGTLITILFLSLVAMVINPHLLQQYISMLRTYQFSDWATPTIGSYLRLYWLGTDNFWVQFIPAILGFAWVIFYWFKRSNSWDWVQEMPIILFVSLIVSPYTWTYDEVVLIPAILLAFLWLSMDWRSWISLLFVAIYAVINLLDLVLHMRLDEFWFIWLAPALFIWFLTIRWQTRKTSLALNLPTEQVNQNG